MEPIVTPELSLLKELDEQRPQFIPSLLSQEERWRCLERGFIGLYRWYVARSQDTRNWNPDRSFDWRNLRKDHSEDIHTILEGFYAVEQYVPDYVSRGLEIMRKSYGRQQFHLRWGAEEEKHSDLWRNAVLFGGKRNLEWIENYHERLRDQEWQLPWEDPLHMIFYTVFQERATQVNYVNLGLVARGKFDHPAFVNEVDPVLDTASRTIAIDEAAHYNFFLEGARLFLYYFPEDSLQAMADVLRHFSMPAREIIPDYDKFGEVLHRTTIFGLKVYARDVVKIALEQLGAEGLKAVEAGIRRSREVPDEFGNMRHSSIFESVDYSFVERKVKRLFEKVNEYEAEVGLDLVSSSKFIENPDYLTFKAQHTVGH